MFTATIGGSVRTQLVPTRCQSGIELISSKHCQRCDRSNGKVQVHQEPLSSKSTFIKNHFHQKPLSSKTNFIKMPLSSKCHFHQKPLSSKTIFIKSQFHQRPLSSKTIFIKNQFLSSKPISSEHQSKNNIVRVCAQGLV